MNIREQRAAHLALRTIAPFAFLLPALALLVVWIVGRAVRPVRRFAAVLRGRKRGALDPLDGDGLPDEIRPVATALNDLLARLKESVERERSFIADAAHELRTPLTALDLQVQSLRARQPEASTTKRCSGSKPAWRGPLVSSSSCWRSRARSGTAAASTNRWHCRMWPGRSSRRCCPWRTSVASTSAWSGRMRSVWPVIGKHCVSWSATYSTMPFDTRPQAARWTCPWNAGTASSRAPCSSSPIAVPASRCQSANRVFDRFHRVPGTASPGSGIGLALVRSIAVHHHALIRLDEGPGGRGLRVNVEFSALDPP